MAIPNSVPFLRLVNPRPFVIATTSTTRSGLPLTQEAIAQQKINNDKTKHLYNECQSLEQALRKQIIDAIPAEGLDSLRNTDTDMINETTPVIIQYLQTNYGRVADNHWLIRALKK